MLISAASAAATAATTTWPRTTGQAAALRAPALAAGPTATLPLHQVLGGCRRPWKGWGRLSPRARAHPRLRDRTTSGINMMGPRAWGSRTAATMEARGRHLVEVDKYESKAAAAAWARMGTRSPQRLRRRTRRMTSLLMRAMRASSRC